MKQIIILLLVTIAASSCTARPWDVPGTGGTAKPDGKFGKHCHRVGSAADIMALGAVPAGDTILLAKGEWRDQQISLAQTGTAKAPIVVMAEEAGKTVFTGNSRLRFSGEWIIVEGLWFRDCTVDSGEIIAFRTASNKVANWSTLRNCAVTGFGLQESMTDYKWVSLYGVHNTVENCSLLEKRNMGTTMVVWLGDDNRGWHIIRGNLLTRPLSILDGEGKSINGQESLRIGTSDVSMTAAGCLVERNWFERCNGETEIISNKSCENLYHNNVFKACVGTLTLRHGNDCYVYGNAIFGDGVEGTGGIRLIGFGHKVYDNYISDTRGSGFTSAICLVQGEANSALNGYFEATDCTVERNTIINCANGITVNYGNSRHSVPVKNNIIRNNRISTASNYYVFTVQTTPNAEVGTTYSGNYYWNGKFKGCTAAQVGATAGTGSLTATPPAGIPTRNECGVSFSVN